MIKKLNWQIVLGVVLIGLSVGVYLAHYYIFSDAHHIFIYLVGDIAFVFLEVFLVTMVLHRLLMHREKMSMIKKLDMVIGAFFSEAGTHLLRLFTGLDPKSDVIKRELIVNNDWHERKFSKLRKHLGYYTCDIAIRPEALEELKDFLRQKRNFFLRLLENPNLLEHESFTNLLWAVFHLTEELTFRKSLNNLPRNDYQHLAGDIKRAYLRLIVEWVSYMSHLKKDYPYLFSLAVRSNPLDEKARIEIK